MSSTLKGFVGIKWGPEPDRDKGQTKAEELGPRWPELLGLRLALKAL